MQRSGPGSKKQQQAQQAQQQQQAKPKQQASKRDAPGAGKAGQAEVQQGPGEEEKEEEEEEEEGLAGVLLVWVCGGGWGAGVCVKWNLFTDGRMVWLTICLPSEHRYLYTHVNRHTCGCGCVRRGVSRCGFVGGCGMWVW